MKKIFILVAGLISISTAPVQAASIGTDVYGLMNEAANVYYQDIYKRKHHYRIGLITAAGAAAVTAHYRGLLPKSGAIKPYWELGLGIGGDVAVLASLGIILDVADRVAVEPYLGVAAPGTAGIGINLAYEL